VSEAQEAARHASPGKALVRYEGSGGDVEWADLRSKARWLKRRQVVIFGAIMIVAQVAWKAQFLGHLYFSQDDFVNLDIAIRSKFGWSYLTLVDAGHLFPGLRAVLWVLARISLYDWGLASAVSLVLLSAASLAALRLLRTLFGERPAILVPLAIYLISPLTLPGFGWWASAMESLPLQLATFMALNAHVCFVRSGRVRHLVAATAWLAFGMLFFEKGLVLPLLLLAITAGFIVSAGSWLGGVALTLRQHWRAWLTYAVLTGCYVVIFLIAIHRSPLQPQAPSSASAVVSFGSVMVRDTLLTGAIGGPWQWLPISGGLYAISAPPVAEVWFATLIALGVLVVSIMLRPIAWRAWATFAGWVVLADMVPILLGRLTPAFGTILGLETRYLADAVPVLAVCVGLAFWPVTGAARTETPGFASAWRRTGSQPLKYAAFGLVGVFVFGSIWSDQSYQHVTPGGPAIASYVANVKQAVKLTPRGTNVVNLYMPQDIVEGLFGQSALQSSVIGDLQRGKLIGKLHWINAIQGTIGTLRMFGPDGRLYPAVIAGVYSLPRTQPGFKGCWPEKNGQVVVKLQHTTSVLDWTLQIAYIWGGPPSWIDVQYGQTGQGVRVEPGVNAAYLPVTGDVNRFTIYGLGKNHICVGTSASGELVPYGTPVP
jgi:hypothetical protein